jgi:hypothetical protein
MLKTEAPANTSTSTEDQDIWASLLALKANTPASILKMRSSGRIEMRTKVLIYAGNASQRNEPGLEGTTADVSQGGCQVLLGRPIWVGDYYLIEFDREHLDVPPTMARCLRCRMINEDAFEIGMKFNHSLEISF